MPDITVNLCGNINISLHCSICHKPLEATMILDPDNNQISVSVDTVHACEKFTKKIKPSDIN